MVRAAVLTRFEEPIQIQRFPAPAKLEPKALLVKVRVGGVCGTDVHLWHGRLKVPTPFILGHEAVGEIEALGSEVSTDSAGRPVKEGDRVMWSPGVPCGRCYFCLRGQNTKCSNRRVYGVNFACSQPPHLFGDFAERVYLVPGTYFFRAPEEVSDDALISFGCAGPTMVHGYERIGGIHPGDSVVIQGAGPVGLFALILAKESGARETIVVGGPTHRLKAAKSMGADHVIDIDEMKDPKARVQRVLDLTEGYGADVVVEAAGVPEAVQEGWLMAKDAGRYLEVGQYTDRGPVPLNPHIITRKHLAIYGSWGQMPVHMDRYMSLIAQLGKKYAVENMVTHRFPLERVMDGIRAVEKWEAVKATIVPG